MFRLSVLLHVLVLTIGVQEIFRIPTSIIPAALVWTI